MEAGKAIGGIIKICLDLDSKKWALKKLEKNRIAVVGRAMAAPNKITFACCRANADDLL